MNKLSQYTRKFLPQQYDPFIIYSSLMLACFVLAFFGRADKNLASPRNGQIAITAVLCISLFFNRTSVTSFWQGTVSKLQWRLLFGISLLAFCAETLTRYWSFKIGGYNFSIFDLMMYHTYHDNFMYTPICDCNHFAVHLNWILFPLLPFHYLFQSHYFLLLLHVLVIWLAAFPLRRLCRTYLHSERLSFLVLLAYFSNARIGSVLGYSFHPEVFYLPLGFLLIEAFERDKIWLALLCIIGFWATKEDAPLYTASFGLAALLYSQDQKRWWGLLCFVFSIGFFFLNTGYLHPYVQKVANYVPAYLNNWSSYGASTPEAMLGFIKQPHRVAYDLLKSHALLLFASVLFLPLLSPRALLAMLPSLVILATSNKDSMRHHAFYHSAAYLAFFFWGLLLALPKLKQFKFLSVQSANMTFAGAILLLPLVGNGSLHYFNPNSQQLKDLRHIKAIVAKTANLYCVQTAITPHLPYPAQIKNLSSQCMATPNAVGIANLQLPPYPLTNEQLEHIAAEFPSVELPVLLGGFKLFSATIK